MSGPFGVTLTGFSRKRLTDIVTSLANTLAPTFGVDPASVASGAWPNPASVPGQLVNAFAQELDLAWGTLEATWQAADPDQATGASLSLLLAQNLLRYLPARATTVQACLLATEGTLVPAGTRYSESTTSAVFQALADVTVARAAVLRVKLQVGTVANTTLYTTTVNGTPYNFTSGGGATAVNIAAGLVAALAAQTTVTVVDHLDGTYTLEAADLATAFSFDLDARQVVVTIESGQACAAVDTGAIPCLTGHLDTIATPVVNLTAVTNLQDGVLGQDLETAAAARLRRRLTLARSAKATAAAIAAKLLSGDVPGVTAATVLENFTDNTDANNLPPHSVSAVVVGGNDLDVANAIWATRCAGINTYGNENQDGTQAGGNGTGVAIVDAQGFAQTVHFARPVKKYAWIAVTLHLYSEETFPDGGAALVAANILALGEGWRVGEDLLLQRFYTPSLIVGVARADITTALMNAPTDSPSYNTTDLAVGPAAVAVFDSARITVTVA